MVSQNGRMKTGGAVRDGVSITKPSTSPLPKLDLSSLMSAITAPMQRLRDGGLVHHQAKANVQALQEGGVVNQSPKGVVNVNLQLNDREFQTTASKDTAADLLEAISQMNAVYGKRKRKY